MGSTSAEERRKESKRGGAARTERPRPPGEASTTGAAQRALALEPGSFRYAYRTGQAARCRDVARSLENRMETTTSVPKPREDGALSLRTSRRCGRRLTRCTLRGVEQGRILPNCLARNARPEGADRSHSTHSTNRKTVSTPTITAQSGAIGVARPRR